MREKLYAASVVLAVTYLATDEPAALIVALILCMVAMFTERVDS